MVACWGADRSSDPSTTVAIAGNATSFYLDPGYFHRVYRHLVYARRQTRYSGPLSLYQPQINLSIWDVDTNTDITRQSVPMSANITYRIAYEPVHGA